MHLSETCDIGNCTLKKELTQLKTCVLEYRKVQGVEFYCRPVTITTDANGLDYWLTCIISGV